MPRQSRIHLPGGIYHIIQRGNERRKIFLDDADRTEFLKRLEAALEKTGSVCYGWALMPNHFHLVMRAGVRPLGDAMRRVLTGYAIYFNRRHKRSGHLYQNRYKAILCDEEAYLLELVRYVHLNPVRAGIVKSVDHLRKYPWSGHSVLAGQKQISWQDTNAVLERFGSTKAEAVRKYICFVEDGVQKGRQEALRGGGLVRSAGGKAGVAALRRAGDRWRSDERVLGDGRYVEQVLKHHDDASLEREKLLRQGWDVEKLVNTVCKLFKIPKEILKRKGRSNAVTQAKALIVYWGKEKLGMTGADIGAALGISRQAASLLFPAGERYARDNNINLTS
jgi:REP element-mobilizing transposase RayT